MYNLDTNNPIYRYQPGFLSGDFTVYQLIDLYNQNYKVFYAQKSSGIVLRDISKTFDHVWHKGLVHRLKQYGFSENITPWVSSYLSFRSQCVCVGGAFSMEKIYPSRCAAGFGPEPLLFLLLVNDIADSLLGSTQLFADDSTLAIRSNNPTYIEITLNSDLTKLAVWASKWLVNFNSKKTEIMFFSLNQQNRSLPKLYFQHNFLNFVDSRKHLGITLSNDNT